MKLKINKHCFAIFLSLITLSIQSQSFISPLKIPPVLSANFGELRNNHFHSGLDFKTQQTVNKPVFAAEDGYVSRIGVSPTGFGLSLYIDHPSGYTTVYAHLNSFSPQIAEYVREQQYLKESYQVTLFPEKDRFTVKKGEQIVIDNSGKINFVGQTQTEEIASWKNDELIFRKTSLKEAFKTFARYQDLDIEFKDKSFENKLFSGKFNTLGIDNFLFAIQKIYPINILKNQNKIIIN